MDENDKSKQRPETGGSCSEEQEGLHNLAVRDDAESEIPNPNVDVQETDGEIGEDGRDEGFRVLKSAQSFATASCVCAAISLIVGGILLSSVALVLGIVASRKLKRVQGSDWSEDTMSRARKLSRTAFILSIAALVLNLASLVVMLPLISEYVSTGDLSALYGDMSTNLSQSTPGTSSGSKTWG